MLGVELRKGLEQGLAEHAKLPRQHSVTNVASPEILAEGKALYETYCAVCHGERGAGDGPVAAKIPTPPSYRSARVMEFSPGRVFHVITMGAGKMPSYAAQLDVDDRWRVVMYVRASLQGLPEVSPP